INEHLCPNMNVSTISDSLVVMLHSYAVVSFVFFFLMIRPPPTSTLFPYTTLFRSVRLQHPHLMGAGASARERLKQADRVDVWARSEEHTSELQSPCNLVCRLLLEKKKIQTPLAAARRTSSFGESAPSDRSACVCISIGNATVRETTLGRDARWIARDPKRRRPRPRRGSTARRRRRPRSGAGDGRGSAGR